MSNPNVNVLQQELLNTIDRMLQECDELTIAEVLGVLEMIKYNLMDATFNKKET